MNTNLAMGFKGPRMNAMADRAAAEQMYGAEQQRQRNAMLMQKEQAELQREAAKRQALQGVDVTTPGGLGKAAAVYGQFGDVEEAASMSKMMRDMDESQLEIAGKRINLLSKYFNPSVVKDEKSFQWAKQQAQDAGLTVPLENYDPEAIKSIYNQTLTAKDVMDQNNWQQSFNQSAVGKTEPYPDDVVAQKRSIAQAGAAAAPGFEKQESKDYGSELVKQYAAVREAADNANNELNNLHILRNMDLDTGAAQPAKDFFGRWALAMGVPQEALDRMGINDIGTSQSFVGVAENLVLTKMQAQKGPQTENDAKRISKTVASLGNTPEAKDFLLDAAIALRQREVEQANFYERWREDKGTFDRARQAWNHWKSKTPLMGTNPNSKLPVFYQQFMSATKEANPGVPEEEILKLWRKKYGNN